VEVSPEERIPRKEDDLSFSSPLLGEELSLVQKEGKLRVREFLGQIKRDEKGAIILPIFVLREEGRVLGVFNDQAELDGWLRSRV